MKSRPAHSPVCPHLGLISLRRPDRFHLFPITKWVYSLGLALDTWVLERLFVWTLLRRQKTSSHTCPGWEETLLLSDAGKKWTIMKYLKTQRASAAVWPAASGHTAAAMFDNQSEDLTQKKCSNATKVRLWCCFIFYLSLHLTNKHSELDTNAWQAIRPWWLLQIR